MKRPTLTPSAAVWLLGLSQIIGYGTLYYSFSILADEAGRALAVTQASLYGSLSLGLLAGGIVAPSVGKRIDRHGAALVMTAGSLLAALAMAGQALAPSFICFAAATIVTQLVSCLVQYDAAFAALVQIGGRDARRHITRLTLIAGFASTIFWPLTGWLETIFSWREIFLGFAALNLFVCLPVHALLAAAHHSEATLSTVKSESVARLPPLPEHLQRRALWLVAVAFALAGFALSAVLAQMVPLLTTLGLGTSALVVSTLFGPAQVLIRFADLLLAARRHPIAASLLALSLFPVALVVLLLSPTLAGAVTFALVLGFGSGLKSIVQGTLPLALFGSASYGARLGFLALARQVLAAAAPFAFSALQGAAGTTLALASVAAIAAAGVMAMVAVWRLETVRQVVPVAADEKGSLTHPG